MRRIDLFDFVNLGEGLRTARSLKGDESLFDAYVATLWLRRQLGELLEKGIFEHRLIEHDCRRLMDVLDNIEKEAMDSDADPKATLKSTAISYGLTSSLQSFTSVLAAECRQAATYSVGKVGIYSTAGLIESATSAFTDTVTARLSDMARSEYDASAKCLAFRLPTAAGFHMMRAVESVLVPYVRIFSGRSFKSLNTNWGSYIDHLETILKSKRRKKPRKSTIDLLRQLKNNHRNPVMHADLVLTEQEARDIFAIGGVVISTLAAEISDCDGTIEEIAA